jgi:hypothetical protein
MAAIQPRIGGVFHNAIAPWSPVTYSFDVRGCKEASWSIYLPSGKRHPALYRGALVELMRGAKVIWAGVLAEPNWREGRMVANGIAYEASRYPALDGSGNGSSTPSVVAAANMTRGWPILGVDDSVWTAAFTATAEGSNDQTALYDAVTDALGQWWHVQADQILRMTAAPTEPTLHIRPKVVDLGNTDDDYASVVAVRYQASASTYATALREDTDATARFGYRVFMHDVTAYGEITAAAASIIGDGILAKGRARLGWTSSIEVSSSELLTNGGVSADLAKVEGGRQLLRVHGLYDNLQWLPGRTHLDVLIGESVYTDGDDVITLNPVGKVAETLEEIAEEQARMLGLVAST